MTETATRSNSTGRLAAAIAGIYLLVVVALVAMNLSLGDYAFASGVLNGGFAALAAWFLYNHIHGATR